MLKSGVNQNMRVSISFFFSSRRRHTRFDCDWSSDVCSSDLPRSWLLNKIKKVEQLRFLENSERTLGQAALQWLLADDRVASTLPNIYNEEQLEIGRASCRERV